MRSRPSPVRRAFEGERYLSQDAYRLWLADEYQIKRNDVFDRFVMGDATSIPWMLRYRVRMSWRRYSSRL
jgi:hypothetical protein